MREIINQEMKSMLKLQKPPKEVKGSVISAWKKKHLEQKVSRVLASGLVWLIAGTLMTLLLRRTHGA